MKKIIFGLSFLAGTFLTACDDILDVNKDPNNPATSTAELTLPVAQVGLAATLESDYNILGSMLAHYWTTGPTAAQYDFIDKYNIRTTDFDRSWIFTYSSVLSDLEFVRTYGLEHNQTSYSAIAQLLQVYTFQVLVDLYDKIPYSDALKGDAGNFAPSFEDGDKIYDNLIVKIDEALAWINTSPGLILPGDDDLIYGGNMENWRKFANTLKLKIYIRQSGARPAIAEAGIKALYDADAVFIAPGEDARVNFSTATHNENPLWQELNQTTFENLVASETSLDYLRDVNDSRLDAYYDPSDDGQFVGLPQGEGTQDGGEFADYARPNRDDVINASSPAYLMTGYESLFMQAEVANKGWSSEDDKTLYDAAVTASFDFWDKDAAPFLAGGGSYEYDGTLELIYRQKWMAFNGKQGLEGWLEWRRTDVPNLPLSLQGRPLSNEFPLRLIWPITERSANPNVPTITTVDTPVWWDTNF